MINKINCVSLKESDQAGYALVHKENYIEIVATVNRIIDYVNELDNKINYPDGITLKVRPIKHELPYSAGMFGTVKKKQAKKTI